MRITIGRRSVSPSDNLPVLHKYSRYHLPGFGRIDWHPCPTSYRITGTKSRGDRRYAVILNVILFSEHLDAVALPLRDIHQQLTAVKDGDHMISLSSFFLILTNLLYHWKHSHPHNPKKATSYTGYPVHGRIGKRSIASPTGPMKKEGATACRLCYNKRKNDRIRRLPAGALGKARQGTAGLTGMQEGSVSSWRIRKPYYLSRCRYPAQ